MKSLAHHNWEACNEVDDEELFEILEEMWEEVREAGNALYHIYKWWIFPCDPQNGFKKEKTAMKTAEFQQEVVEL